MHHRSFIVPALVLAALPAAAATLPDGLYAEFTTPRGVIVCRLEYRKAPMTVSSFVGLAEGTIAANGVTGRRYFDGLTFHRVEPGFVIQGGCPRGDGNGGPGYALRCEITRRPYGRGAVGMALSGKDTGGSQLFITLAPAPHLDGAYTVLGWVADGMAAVDRIRPGDRIERAEVWTGR
jgi:cyclophilin family peptidyl-prolyl cis-trans isomerase